MSDGNSLQVSSLEPVKPTPGAITKAKQCQRKQKKFLAAYAKLGRIDKATEAVGIGRETHYVWMMRYPEYRAAFEQARESVADLLEDAAYKRAVEGIPEPVYQRGECVGTIQRYSDPLLALLLRGARPDRYAPREGAAGGPTAVQVVIQSVLGSNEPSQVIDVTTTSSGSASDNISDTD